LWLRATISGARAIIFSIRGTSVFHYSEDIMKAKLYLADARSMQELENESVQLIITSPPYWHIKDYGVKGQEDVNFLGS